MNSTNTFFERGSKSLLLVESGVSHSGLFQTGDRFIPFRADEDMNNCGPMRFCHEENMLLSRQAKRNRRRNRRNTSTSDSSRSRSRNSSRSRSNSRSSNNSES